ncbi:MAG: TrkA family potassium uptake protein [Clostridia bacterium]|nr:TrkA family potassium uptake protein [Clostridia bacterium]
MKSFLVLGMSTFGKHLAFKLQEMGNEVVIVDRNEDLIEELAQYFTDAQAGDCCNEAVLRTLGINDYDICFVTVGGDFQSSLEITASLKELGANYVAAEAKQDRQMKILQRIGADEVLYPAREAADKTAVRFSASNITDFFQITDEYSVFEVPAPAQWIGKSIADLNVRKKYRLSIIAVKNGDNLISMPDSEYVFSENDKIVAIAKDEDAVAFANKEK